MARMNLRSWRCPSRNTVDAYFTRDRHGVEHVWFEWDEPPPLLPADELFYLAVIVPETARLVDECTERRPTRRALYVRL